MLAVAAAAAGRAVPSSGKSASMGITAMSWNSKTAKALRPPSVFIRPFSLQRLQHDRGRRQREDQADRQGAAASQARGQSDRRTTAR